MGFAETTLLHSDRVNHQLGELPLFRMTYIPDCLKTGLIHSKPTTLPIKATPRLLEIASLLKDVNYNGQLLGKLIHLMVIRPTIFMQLVFLASSCKNLTMC